MNLQEHSVSNVIPFPFASLRMEETAKRKPGAAGAARQAVADQSRIEREASKKILATYRELMRKVQKSLENARGFSAFHLGEIEASLKEAMADFESKATLAAREAVIEAGREGTRNVDQNIEKLGVKIPLIGVDPAAVKVLADFIADKITAVSRDTLSVIMSEIRLAVVGGRSLRDAREAIRSRLTAIRKSDGTRIGPAARAEMIVRTETLRAFSLAGRERIRELSEREDELARAGVIMLKEWVSTTDDRTRPEHLEADGQRVGLDEPFIVGGEELMEPRDPNGSPGNTIQCRCARILVAEEELAA